MPQPYIFNEGQITLPSVFVDRTVNIFMQEPVAEGLTNVHISRDTLKENETLEQYVERQIALLKKSLKGLVLRHNEAIKLTGCAQVGVEIETHYKSDGKPIYQRQCGVLIGKNKVMVFTITNAVPFREKQLAAWHNILNSFKPNK